MRMPNESGIYEIVNLVNNKRYIGQAKNIKIRETQHLSCLRNPIYNSRKENIHLWNSWKFYGEENFEFRVICLCSLEDLTIMETYWIKITPKEFRYNIREAVDSNLGTKRTEESRAKMSAWQVGKQRTEDFKLKMAEIMKGNSRRKSKPVQQLDLVTGEIIAEYESATEVERLLGIRAANIANMCNNTPIIKNGKKYYKKSAGGFDWQFA